MNHQHLLFLRTLAVAALLLPGLRASAATHDVTIVDFSFNPPSLSITAGDTVRWTNSDGVGHTSTSDTGVWGSPLLGQGGSFSRTFNSPGTFGYHCTPHPFMQGTIAVNAPQNQPPTVSLTAPSNNTVLGTPGTLKLQATASDTDGQVVRVEFFAGTSRLGVSVKEPFEMTTTLKPGPSSITAVAYDNQGGVTTSAAALVTVNAAERVAMGSIASAGADMSVNFLEGGGPFILQRSDDLFCGVWINDRIALTRTMTTAAGDPQRFLRVADLAEQESILLTTTLSGAAERPNPVTTSGTGSGLFRLNGNHLVFNITYSGLSAAANAAHIHGPAPASGTANVLINLGPFNAGGFGVAGTLAGEVILTAAQKQELLAGRTYVNIHTGTHSGGEIRGQIIPAAFQARLAGVYERPNRVNTPAKGFGAFVLAGDQLSFNIHYQGLTGPAISAHIHGPATVDQSIGVLIDLDSYKGAGFGASGTFVGTVTLTPAQLAAVVDGLTYVNIHTSAHQPGEIRGQILPHVTGVPLTAVLTGDAEKPNPVTTSATGSAMFMLEGRVLNFSLRYADLSGPAIGAHIHGPASSTGGAGVLVDLLPYVDGAFGTGGAIAGSIVLTDGQKADVLAGRTYVNIHTGANQPGEIRGQII
ncbi:MAG TPA: hypothetical protein DCY13_06295, partial [Verrucomicrobiales bacterium]|nr:hypothetical protein [Verrucomicrobiales bacterium]